MSATEPKLDIDATRERLVAVRCWHAAEHLDHVLSEAVRQEVAPHAFLDQLLQTELYPARVALRPGSCGTSPLLALGQHGRGDGVPLAKTLPPIPG